MAYENFATYYSTEVPPPAEGATTWFSQPFTSSPYANFSFTSVEGSAFETQHHLNYSYTPDINLIGVELGDIDIPGGQFEHALPLSPSTLSNAGDTSHGYQDSTPASAMIADSSSHVYRPLPSLDQDVDQWLEPYDFPDKRAYRCTWPGCFEGLPRNKYNARLHAHKHLGTAKLFECVTCGQQFMSEANARRHRDNQSKVFRCDLCDKKFARRDYCQVHRAKCTRRKLR